MRETCESDILRTTQPITLISFYPPPVIPVGVRWTLVRLRMVERQQHHQTFPMLEALDSTEVLVYNCWSLIESGGICNVWHKIYITIKKILYFGQSMG
jgi:hypothetical protein